MDNFFSSKEFIQSLAQELVDSFAKAGKGTTPGLVGSAREHVVRSKLEKIFPQAVGVSTGCVIDVNNNTSKQTDIIIYEKGICPVFSIADTPESSYYPCEGVIAVGEVKSTLGTSELLDAFNKIESVKRLHRFGNDGLCFRKYCSNITIQGAKDEKFDQTTKPLDQIFGFIICEKIGLTEATFVAKCIEEINRRTSDVVPNMIISLQDGVFFYSNSEQNRDCLGRDGADSLFYAKIQRDGFQILLSKIYTIITQGRTTDVMPFTKYIFGNSAHSMFGTVYKLDTYKKE